MSWAPNREGMNHMLNANRFLLAGVAIAMVSGSPVSAASQVPRPILLAQADTQVPEAVAEAEAKVEAANAALREAMASGEGVKEARQALFAAMRTLNDARDAAGLPPATADVPPPNQMPPIDKAKAPPLPEEAPVPAVEAKKQKPKLPADEAKAPPLPEETPAPPAEAMEQKPKLPADEAKAPPPEETPAPPAEAKKQKPKPAIDEAKAPPPPEEAPVPTTEAKKQKPKLPADEAKAPPTAQAPALQAKGEAPTFDPSLLKKPHPRFGEAPKGEDKTQLPKEEAQIPKGGEVKAGAGRTIVKEDNGQVTVRHDDTDRFRQAGGNVDVQKGPNGTTTTTVNRTGGVQVVTVRDRDGNILQRYRKDKNGQIEVLIGEAGPQKNGRQPPPPKAPAPQASFDFHVLLPPLKLNIPHDQYVVESSRASRQDLTRTFGAPPVEKVERPYTLEEIRRSDRIRNKVRRVDFDTVTFEFGSAILPDDQIPEVQKVGEAMRAVLDQDPNQVFLIEGHTDAVGSDLANLALSDRRAETVAEILTYYFTIPPENLVTQGYGEQFLKVPTTGPERENRRVAFRNITPLMRTGAR